MSESSRNRGAASVSLPGYGAAIGLSLIAMAVTWLSFPVLGVRISSVLYIAVILAAWSGGVGPAILAVGLCVLAYLALLLPPLGSPDLSADEILSVLVFLSVSTVIVLIAYSRDRVRRARDRALAALRLSEARFEAMTDCIAEATLLLSPDSRVLDINRQFEELLGIAEERVRERPFADLTPVIRQAFADPERLLAMVTEVEPDDHDTYEETLVQHWPKRRELLVCSTPVLREDETQEHFGRLYAFREIAQERQVDRLKAGFISLVSHELRTPLTSIKGFTDLILDGDAGLINEETQEYLEIVQSNADRLVALVNDLLDISRIESGRIELDIEPLDLDEIVDEVVAVMRSRIEQKQQRLSVELAPEARWIQGDHEKVVQALSNYVSNAHKYTPAGGSIRIHTARENAFCRLVVTDTGIGIAPGDQEQLFTRFYRVDSSLTAEVGGTGLGLAIVKSIVELMGGWVGVESQPGEGSTFYMTLPLAEERPSAETGPVAAAEREWTERPVARVAGDRGRQRVLVIDDDPSAQEPLSAELEKRGLLVTLATDGATGLAMAWQQQPGLILLDLSLPGMDGLAVLQALKQDAATAKIPVITVAAREGLNAGTRAKVLSLGACNFLTKPFDLESMIQEILLFVQEKE